ncbi:MAG: ImmA/IrrE family metallo-endopeptidase [Tissierellia bacterium]|nr:ImmA/IrrE family metallo-endopeptidase [Tissierellia bacterium]
MHYNMLKKAIDLLTEYQIFEYPIYKDTIEQVISNIHLRTVVLKNLSTTIYINDTILLPKTQNKASYREDIVHELGHAYFHCGNSLLKDKIVVRKQEMQANAFAAYFLMPVYVFEEALKYCSNDYELAEEFGVTVSFVQFRKKLTEALIKDGYFDEVLELNDID